MNDLAKRVEELTHILNEANYNYYVNDNPTISDQEYDKYLRELINIETEHPELADPNSPTKRVGGQVIDKFNKIVHARPMLSLANVFNEDEIRDFDGLAIAFTKKHVLLKQQNSTSITTQTYEEISNTIDLSGINKDYILNMFSGENSYNILANIFAIIFISTFLTYFLTAILDTIALSLLGFIVSRLIRIPFKYGALYSLSISAITLPVILNAIYLIANMFTGFVIPYFQIMYTLIAYVYLIAALLIMRSEIIKKKVQIQIQIMNKNYNPEELQKQDNKNEKEQNKEDKPNNEKEDSKNSKENKERNGAGTKLKNNKDNPEPQANIQSK